MSDLNFNWFSKSVDDYMPNIDMNLKFELFIPLCQGPQGDDWQIRSFDNFINDAFGMMDVTCYNDNVLYNPKLFAPLESLC